MTLNSSSMARVARIWREVGDRVYVRRYRDYNVTIGLIVGDGDMLLVDTRASERQARELQAEVRFIGQGRLHVVNTHHHYDHVFGNFMFLPSDIWGHESCALHMREDSQIAQTTLAAAMPEIAQEYNEIRVTPPNKTFRDRAQLEIGGRRVELHHFGRGHTDNDVAVVVPDVNVIFAGDLVEEGGPPAFEDSYPMDWPGTLAGLLEAAHGLVVPGHGEVVTRSFVGDQLSDLAALAQLARQARFDGGFVSDAISLAPFPPDAARLGLMRAFAQLAGEL
jgi:glyoxylase-like metal-dependent hydrolase (beta-lactamase superfamily II)